MYKIIGGDGKEYGPVSAEQLRQWVAEGRVNAQTQVQTEGNADWKTIADFPDLGATGPAIPPVAVPVPPTKVPNYLVQAILATLFCCLPFGIAAIVFAAQVNTKLAADDMAGALESSRKAKLWCWWSVGGWAAMVVIYLIFIAVLAAGAFHPR